MKHSPIIKIQYLLIPLLVFLFAACEKKKEKVEYVARVNGSYLTVDALNNALLSKRFNKKSRDEFIEQWVESELLYQQAVDEDIITDDNYKQIIEQSKKELAVSLFIKKYLDGVSINYSADDLQNFYVENISDFRLVEDAYVLNIIILNDEEKAVLFRSTLIESGWNKALNVFKGDLSITESREKQFYLLHQLQPIAILRTVENLIPGETSVLLSTEPKYFTIVQLLKKYDRDDIPEFDVVKDDVKDRYIALHKKLLFKEEMENLFSKNDIEIKKDE